jgi:Flp pilus assembly protein TadG
MSAGRMARRDGYGLRRRSADTGEHGFTIVIVALTMTLMVTITAIVIDLGNTYATHRQVQNAVDAAAMAATRQLAKGATGATILSTAQSVVGANGADSSSVVCRIIANTLTPTPFPFLTNDGDPLTCANYTSRTNYPTADGVWVSASKTNNTFFGGIVNAPTLSTSAVAAATAQPLRVLDSLPLFAACGDDQQIDQNSGPPQVAAPPLLLDGNGNPPNPTTNPNPVAPVRVNPAAIYNSTADGGKGGPSYLIHAPSGVDTCGASSSSDKGLILIPVTVSGSTPGSFDDHAGTGVVAGPTRSSVANQPGCDLGASVGCVMVLPICDRAQGGGSNVYYRCEYFGSFKLLTANSNTDTVALLGPAFPEASYGQGGLGVPGASEVYVIKLVV